MSGRRHFPGGRSNDFDLEALEQRVLLSADGVVPVPPAGGPAVAVEDSAGPEVAGTEELDGVNSAVGLGMEPGAEPERLPELGSSSGESAGNERSGVGLHAVTGIPTLVSPGEASTLLLAPGKVSLDLGVQGAGRAGLWKFVLPTLPTADGRGSVQFKVQGVTALPTDVALAWYDESGNRLGVADDAGAGTIAGEDSGVLELEKGRVYLVGVFANRSLPADALRLDVRALTASPGEAVAIDSRTGAAAGSFLELGEVFQSPSDVRWHPLGLLNAGAEARISVSPETAGRDVEIAVYRKLPVAQLVGSPSDVASYAKVASAVSAGSTAAQIILRAPDGSTLSEQEYVLAVSPKDYQTAVSGYRVDIQAAAPLVAPAVLTTGDVSGAKPLKLKPTATAGEAESALEDLSIVGSSAQFFTLRAPATGLARIEVDAGFDAVVALYSANRTLIEVATASRQGVVTLRETLSSTALYYLRVVNGPDAPPLERSGYGIHVKVATSPRGLSIAAPDSGTVVREGGSGGFSIGTSSNTGPSFFTLQPGLGIDVITVLAIGPGGSTVRVGIASVDGYVEQTFGGGGGRAALSFPIATQGAPVQFMVDTTGGQGTLLAYNAMTLPRTLPIGTMTGVRLSPETGDAERTVSGFDRSGDRAGFEFYQGLVTPNQVGQWTAEGVGGASPVLARYEATGSELRLVDWVLADAVGQASLSVGVQSDRLYAVVAYQGFRQDNASVKLRVNHPASIPVGVGMVPDLEYEAQNRRLAKYRYILQIRGVTLEKSYEEDYWETLLPDRFFGGNEAEDPAWPLIELAPDTPGSALRVRLTLLDGTGNPLKRWNGDPLPSFTSGNDGVVRVDLSNLGVMKLALEGRNLRFRVQVLDGALGDGTYTLRMTVRTPNQHPYEVNESQWAFPGGGTIPEEVGFVSQFPAGTTVTDIAQDPFGEGSASGVFVSSAVGVHLYRFWTPSKGPFRVWTEGAGSDPANTTIRLYRARYAVTNVAERASWWETVDYLEELDQIGPSTDWYPADRSEIDAQILIQDPQFPAYKKPTDDLGQSTVGDPVESQLGFPYLPADRQFTDDQDVYFVVVKNEQGSTGGYRLKVSTEDLPRYQSEPVNLPLRPTAAQLRSVLSVDVPGVERYGNRIGVWAIQMPGTHTGYLGVEGQAGASWRWGAYDENGDPLAFLGEVSGERRYAVPSGAQVVYLRVQEVGRNTDANNRITLSTTLAEDAALPTNFSSLGLGGVAHTLLPTNPWGELDAGDFTGSASVDSSGKVYRFRAPTGIVDVAVTPVAGSVVSFVWGIYDDGRLLAWNLSVPGQPGTQRATISVGPPELNSSSKSGRNLVLVVRHASASVQPAQYGITVEPKRSDGFVFSEFGQTAVPLSPMARDYSGEPTLDEVTEVIEIPGSELAPWTRFRVPDGPGAVPSIVDLPTSENVYPLRYDLYDATGKVRIVSGTKAFSSPQGVIALPELEPGKAYYIRLSPRDQPLAQSLPVHIRFRPEKMEQSSGEYVHSVPNSSVGDPPAAQVVYPDFRGDFSVSSDLSGVRTVWWYHDVPKAGPATIEAVVQGSSRVRIAIYRAGIGSVEFPKSALVDFVNEESVEVTADGKKFKLETFLGTGRYYIEVTRSNTNGGRVDLEFRGPEYDLERLTPDPVQGATLRAEMGRTDGTRFFEVTAPAGSKGPAIFLAYDLDLLDGRPEIAGKDFTKSPPEDVIAQLYLKARMQVWAVSDGIGVGGVGGLSQILVATLDRDPATKEDPEKASLTTPGVARPFQRYIIGIQSEGHAVGFSDNVSVRSKSVGVQAVFDVPNSGTPDLVVETMRLLPNSGQTLVEVTVLNRGYALALGSQSKFSYPTLDASQPIAAILAESMLGPQARRVRYLDWVDPTSPNDVTRYQLDVAGDIAELDEANNERAVALKTVDAHRPVFTVTLSGNRDGNADAGVWGRYLDSRGHDSATVLADIILEASDGDDAADTFNGDGDLYRLRSDSPLLNTSGNKYLSDRWVMERVELSRLAPTGPSNPNIFVAYAADRFGLRSAEVVRVVQVVPFPKWMDAGETEVTFNPDTGQYELDFSARPINYAATLTQMLDANVPLVGDLQNRFYVEAIAERSFSLNPEAGIAPILPSVRARTTVLGQDILNKVFAPGSSQDHVSVQGHIDVRPDTLEAGAFELTTRFDQYPVDHWEGPEIPIFGFDAAIVSAAVQAQVIVDLKFDAAITFAFDLTQTNAPLRITSPSYVGLDLRVDLRFEGEVEVAGFLDIASVGGSFFFTLKPRYGLEEMSTSIPLEDFIDEACLGLSATLGGELSADIFGFEVFSLEMESDEIQLTDCDVATAAEAGAASLTGTTGVLKGGGVALHATPAVRTNDKFIRLKQRTQAGDAPLLSPSVRSNPQLVLNPGSGDRLVAFLEAGTGGAPPVLQAIRGDSTRFLPADVLTSAEWMSRPILAWTNDGAGNRAVVVYQAAPVPAAGATRNQFLAGQDLKYRYFDGTSWSEELTLTDNATLDWQASMAFNANGDGMLVWVQNASAAPLDAKGKFVANDRLMASRWDKVAHRWTAPSTVVATGIHNQPSVTLSANGTAYVAWIRIESGRDRIGLASRTLTGPWNVTNMEDAALPVAGRFRKVGLSSEADGRVTIVTAFTEAAVEGKLVVTRILSRTGVFGVTAEQARAFDVIAVTGGVSSLQLQRAPDGTLLVGWHERRGGFSDAVVARRGASGSWLKPARVTQGVGDERAFRFVIAGDGSVWSVFERGVHFYTAQGGAATPGDGPTLGIPTGALGQVDSSRAVMAPELSFIGPMMLGGELANQRPEGLAGTTVDAEVELWNSGGTAADALVTFYRANLLNPDARGEAVGDRKVRLLPGGTLKVIVPVDIRSGVNRYTAEVVLAGATEGFSSRNNTVTGQITGRIDFAVENAEVVETLGGTSPQTDAPVGLRYEVVNRSGVAYRGPMRLTAFWEDPSKPGVTTQVQSGVADVEFGPGERKVLSAVFNFATAGLRLLGVELSGIEGDELDAGNNRVRVPLDLRPDLALKDVNVEIRGKPSVVLPALSVRVVDDSGVGNADIRVAVSNTGNAPARSFTVRLFHSVDGGAFNEVLTQTVSKLLKPGEHEVASFKGPALAGTNLYRADVAVSVTDLPTGLPERVTADNVAMALVVVQGLPDLRVGAVTFNTPGGNPPALRIGATARVDVRVDNAGIAAAKGVLVEIFSHTQRQVGDGILLGAGTIASIDALGTATIRISLDTTVLPADADAIRVVVDRHQNILEKSDLNNEGGKVIVVAPPTFFSTGVILNGGIGQLSQVSSLSMTLNRDLLVPRDPGVLQIRNVDTGELLDPAKYVISLDAATRTLTWRFTGFAGGVLPAGEYVARVGVGAFSDRAGNSLGRETVLRFTVTPGDANGDGTTNERDYLLVWRELRKAEAARSLRADVNGDGLVTAADLELVRGNFGGRGAEKGKQP